MSSAESDVQLQDFSNIFSLKGKVAVVSGGSRGLGLHAASGCVVLALVPTGAHSADTKQSPPSRLLESLHHIPQSQRMRRSCRSAQRPPKQRTWCESILNTRRQLQSLRD